MQKASLHHASVFEQPSELVFSCSLSRHADRPVAAAGRTPTPCLQPTADNFGRRSACLNPNMSGASCSPRLPEGQGLMAAFTRNELRLCAGKAKPMFVDDKLGFTSQRSQQTLN
jgi:hypothetical protein